MKPNLRGQCPPEIDLSAFIDGEVSLQQQKAIDQHLALCPKCRQVVEEMEDVVLRLASVPLPQFGKKINIHRQMSKIRHKKIIWRTTAVTIVAIAIIGCVAYSEIAHDFTQKQLIESYVAEHNMGRILHVKSFGLYGN